MPVFNGITNILTGKQFIQYIRNFPILDIDRNKSVCFYLRTTIRKIKITLIFYLHQHILHSCFP